MLDIFVIVYLDDILIYTKDSSQPHLEAVRLVLNQLRKYSLFANLKKCCFHQDKVHFLGYIVFSKRISIEAEKIEVVRKCPESKSVQDIQVFLGFTNFYWWFIQGFSRIVAPLISILKTAVPPDRSILEGISDNEGVDSVDGGGVEIAKKSGKSKDQKTSKSQKLAKSKKPSKSENSPNFDTTETGPNFLASKARAVFNRLQLAFIKAPILWHFHPECHIRIKTDASGYAINDVLS